MSITKWHTPYSPTKAPVIFHCCLYSASCTRFFIHLKLQSIKQYPNPSIFLPSCCPGPVHMAPKPSIWIPEALQKPKPHLSRSPDITIATMSAQACPKEGLTCCSSSGGVLGPGLCYFSPTQREHLESMRTHTELRLCSCYRPQLLLLQGLCFLLFVRQMLILPGVLE